MGASLLALAKSIYYPELGEKQANQVANFTAPFSLFVN